MYLWGAGEYGRLGLDDEQQQNTPSLCMTLQGTMETMMVMMMMTRMMMMMIMMMMMMRMRMMMWGMTWMGHGCMNAEIGTG